jgi:NADPH:quinone reductase-like Zn-dependent oxidoreductase
MFLPLMVVVGFGTISLTLFLWSRVTAPKLNYLGAHVLVTGGSSGIGFEIAKGLPGNEDFTHPS